MITNKILEIGEDWKTIDYPESTLGTAEITSITQKAGDAFLMEAVDGHWMYELNEDIKITILKTEGQTAMVDDPLHWIGMQRLAEHASGNVCVIGLGLGLVIHHLVKNPKVTNILVLEYNKDVINLIAPLLPKDKRIKIICENAYDFLYDGFDTLIFDIVTSNRDDFGTDTMKDVMQMIKFIELRANFNTHRMPVPKIMVWGVRDPKYNPAVKTSSDYEEFLGRFSEENKQ